MPRQDTKAGKQTEGRGRQRDAYGFIQNYQESTPMDYAPAQPNIEQSQVQLGDITFGRDVNLVGGNNPSAEIADALFTGIEAAEGIAKTVKTVTKTHDDEVALEKLDELNKFKQTEKWAGMTPAQQAAYEADVRQAIADETWNDATKLDYELQGQEFRSQVDPKDFRFTLDKISTGRLRILASDLPDTQKQEELIKFTEKWQGILDRDFKDKPVLYEQGKAALYQFQIKDHEATSAAISETFESVFPTLEDYNNSVEAYLKETMLTRPEGMTAEEAWLDYYNWLESTGNPLPESFGSEQAFADAWGSRFTESFVRIRTRVYKQQAEQTRMRIQTRTRSRLDQLRKNLPFASEEGPPSIEDYRGDLIEHFNHLWDTDRTGGLFEQEMTLTLASMVPIFYQHRTFTGPWNADEVIDDIIQEEIVDYLDLFPLIIADEAERTHYVDRITTLAKEAMSTGPDGGRVNVAASLGPGVTPRVNSNNETTGINLDLVPLVRSIPSEGGLSSFAFTQQQEVGEASFTELHRRVTKNLTVAFFAKDPGSLDLLAKETGLEPKTVLAMLARVTEDPSEDTIDEQITKFIAQVRALEGSNDSFSLDSAIRVRGLFYQLQRHPVLLEANRAASIYRDGEFIERKSYLIESAERIKLFLEDPEHNDSGLITTEGVITLDERETEEDKLNEFALEGKAADIVKTILPVDFARVSLGRPNLSQIKERSKAIVEGIVQAHTLFQNNGRVLGYDDIKDILDVYLEGGKNADKTIGLVYRKLQEFGQETLSPEAVTELVTRIGDSLYDANMDMLSSDDFEAPDYQYPEYQEGGKWNYVMDPRNQKAFEGLLQSENWLQAFQNTFGSDFAFSYPPTLGAEAPTPENFLDYVHRNGFELEFELDSTGNKSQIKGLRRRSDVSAPQNVPIMVSGVSGAHPDGSSQLVNDSWSIDENNNFGASLQTAMESIAALEEMGDLDLRDANALRGLLVFMGNYTRENNQPGSLFTHVKLDKLLTDSDPDIRRFYPLFAADLGFLLSESTIRDSMQLARMLYQRDKENNSQFRITAGDIMTLEAIMRGRARSSTLDATQETFYRGRTPEFQYSMDGIEFAPAISSVTGNPKYQARFFGKNVLGQIVGDEFVSEIVPYTQGEISRNAFRPYFTPAQIRAREAESRRVIGPVRGIRTGITGTENYGRAAGVDAFYEGVDNFFTNIGPATRYFFGEATDAISKAVESFKQSGQELAADTREATESLRQSGQETAEDIRSFDFVEYLEDSPEITKASGGRQFIRIVKGFNELADPLINRSVRVSRGFSQGEPQAVQNYVELVNENGEEFTDFVTALPEETREKFRKAGREWQGRAGGEILKDFSDAYGVTSVAEEVAGFFSMLGDGLAEFVYPERRLGSFGKEMWGDEFTRRASGTTPQELGLSRAQTTELLKLNQKDFQYMVSWIMLHGASGS